MNKTINQRLLMKKHKSKFVFPGKTRTDALKSRISNRINVIDLQNYNLPKLTSLWMH